MLARLVDKSLVTVVGGGSRPRSRYRLLETVRQYANERLVDAAEREKAYERHLHHFARRSPGAEPGWPSPAAHLYVDDLADDYENIRAAIERTTATDPCAGMALHAAMRDLFFMFGQADGRRLAETLLERCELRDIHRAETQITAGILAILVFDAASARRSLAEARALSAELDLPAHEGWARFFCGLLQLLGGAAEAAREDLEASIALHQRSGQQIGGATATAALGLAVSISGDPARGSQQVMEALAVQVEANYPWGEGQANLYLGLIEAEPRRATAHFRRAIECLRRYRDVTLLPVALVGLAGPLVSRDPARALQVTSAAFAIRARAGGQFPPIYRERADAVQLAAANAVGPRADRIWAEGARLNSDDAIALALGTTRPRTRPDAVLSVREEEIVRFVAAGRTNKEVAAQLYLSTRTVETHVHNVLGKLGLANRTQLASWARDHIQ
jgi:DNA-binding CsgD family transcriptional regulator